MWRRGTILFQWKTRKTGLEIILQQELFRKHTQKEQKAPSMLKDIIEIRQLPTDQFWLLMFKAVLSSADSRQPAEGSDRKDTAEWWVQTQHDKKHSVILTRLTLFIE